MTTLDLSSTRTSLRAEQGHGVRPRWQQGAGLAVSLALVAAVSVTGGLWTDTGGGSWYESLDKPAWNPPGWVFGPVWGLLYAAMAVAAWLVWRPTDRPMERAAGLALYAGQLALNLGWTGVFFGLQRPGWALAEITVLAIAIVATLAAFRRLHRVGALLLVPYLGWVLFAASLNAAIAIAN